MANFCRRRFGSPPPALSLPAASLPQAAGAAASGRQPKQKLHWPATSCRAWLQPPADFGSLFCSSQLIRSPHVEDPPRYLHGMSQTPSLPGKASGAPVVTNSNLPQLAASGGHPLQTGHRWATCRYANLQARGSPRKSSIEDRWIDSTQEPVASPSTTHCSWQVSVDVVLVAVVLVAVVVAVLVQVPVAVVDVAVCVLVVEVVRVTVVLVWVAVVVVVVLGSQPRIIRRQQKSFLAWDHADTHTT